MHQRVDHVTAVPDQEQEARARQQRQRHLGGVGGADLLDHHRRIVGKGEATRRTLDHGVQTNQREAPQLGPPHFRKVLRHHVVRIRGPELVHGCRDIPPLLGFDRLAGSRRQMLAEEKLVDRKQVDGFLGPSGIGQSEPQPVPALQCQRMAEQSQEPGAAAASGTEDPNEPRLECVEAELQSCPRRVASGLAHTGRQIM